MAQLCKVISSILRDMVLAQHEANMYAVSLENIYKKDGRLEKFSLPSIAIGDMELELRYGINSNVKEEAEYEINYHALRRQAQDISRELATFVLDTVIQVILENIPPSSDDHIVTLDESPEKKYDFSKFLSRKIFQSFQQSFTALINENGSFNEKTLLECAINVSDNEILHHPELSEIFARQGGAKARKKALETVHTSVGELIPKIVKDVNFMRKRLMPSLDIVVDSEELAKLPEECVHSIHFKLSPKSISFYSDEDL